MAKTAQKAVNPFAAGIRAHKERVERQKATVRWTPEEHEHLIAGVFQSIVVYPSNDYGEVRFVSVQEYSEETGEPTGRYIEIPLHGHLEWHLDRLNVQAGDALILEYLGKQKMKQKKGGSDEAHAWEVTKLDPDGIPVQPATTQVAASDDVPF